MVKAVTGLGDTKTMHRYSSAADDIVSRADALYHAPVAVRSARLADKSSINSASDRAAVDEAEASAIAALDAIVKSIPGSKKIL